MERAVRGISYSAMGSRGTRDPWVSSAKLCVLEEGMHLSEPRLSMSSILSKPVYVWPPKNFEFS